MSSTCLIMNALYCINITNISEFFTLESSHYLLLNIENKHTDTNQNQNETNETKNYFRIRNKKESIMFVAEFIQVEYWLLPCGTVISV